MDAKEWDALSWKERESILRELGLKRAIVDKAWERNYDWLDDDVKQALAGEKVKGKDLPEPTVDKEREREIQDATIIVKKRFDDLITHDIDKITDQIKLYITHDEGEELLTVYTLAGAVADAYKQFQGKVPQRNIYVAEMMLDTINDYLRGWSPETKHYERRKWKSYTARKLAEELIPIASSGGPRKSGLEKARDIQARAKAEILTRISNIFFF